MAIVTKRWDGMRWTRRRRAFLCAGRNAAAYGEVVWSWRRDAGVKLCGKCSAGDGDNKPAHRGEHEVSRKAIAQGMSECSPLTCMLVCAFLCAIWHTRPRVQRAPGIPCALCFQEGQRICKTRAKRAARTPVALTHSSRRPRMSGRSSIPEARVIEPRGRGVLRYPAFAGYDGPGCAAGDDERRRTTAKTASR